MYRRLPAYLQRTTLLNGELMVCCGLDMKFWPQVQEAIAEAFHGNFDKLSMQDVKDAIEAQKMQLWGIHDGILELLS